MRGLELEYPVSPTVRTPLRIAVVNDYELIVQGVARMLADHPDRVVVVERDNGLPVLSKVDVILCDTFARVEGNGIDLADLAEADARLVVYTWSTDPSSIAQAMAQGAAGYLSKGLDATELVEALERVRDGEAVTSLGAGQASSSSHARWPGQDAGLSEREAEILGFIARGLTNQEIADISYLSINTIKTHIRTAYSKIGARRRPEAVIWALQNGFVLEASREVLRE